MRILRCMQEDVPVFSDKKENNNNDVIRSIMRTKEISLEELTRKVTTIQRAWRHRFKSNMIKQYKQVFNQIALKIKKN